jgi:hypothetical protein
MAQRTKPANFVVCSGSGSVPPRGEIDPMNAMAGCSICHQFAPLRIVGTRIVFMRHWTT